jgi:hypothetical protein
MGQWLYSDKLERKIVFAVLDSSLLCRGGPFGGGFCENACLLAVHVEIESNNIQGPCETDEVPEHTDLWK